ncbi:hypothetical protein AB8807_06650 [Xanthomonas campestris pv. olitorii]|nr:hypothetical protein KWH09_06640 [Xanthomonas campestris pv. olitorii]
MHDLWPLPAVSALLLTRTDGYVLIGTGTRFGKAICAGLGSAIDALKSDGWFSGDWISMNWKPIDWKSVDGRIVKPLESKWCIRHK